MMARRRDGSHMTRTVLNMEVEGLRPRVRPTLRYMEIIRRDMKKNGLMNVNILDRKDWRMAVSREFKVVLADWKVKTTCHANGVLINKMLSLNRKKKNY